MEEIATGGRVVGEGKAEPETKKGVSGILRYCAEMTNRAAAGELDPILGRAQALRQ